MRFESALLAVRGLFFPYRTHLEGEIEYLKAQLAQRQRRVDELQEALTQRSIPVPKGRREPVKLGETQPRGWDAYRTARRKHGGDESGEAVSQGPDAGSEVSPSHAGTAA